MLIRSKSCISRTTNLQFKMIILTTTMRNVTLLLIIQMILKTRIKMNQIVHHNQIVRSQIRQSIKDTKLYYEWDQVNLQTYLRNTMKQQIQVHFHNIFHIISTKVSLRLYIKYCLYQYLYGMEFYSHLYLYLYEVILYSYLH